MKLPEVVVTQRDTTMYEMKKQGLTYRQIAKALNVSESTAYRGCKRTSDRIIRQLAIDHGQEVLLDLERIDGMIASFLPFTRPKKIKSDDGEPVEIPPSSDAANTVLKLMSHRAKLLGLDQSSGTEISISTTITNNLPLVSVGGSDSSDVERTPEEEAKHLLAVFREAGVIDDEAFKMLISANAVPPLTDSEDIVDAELVEDEIEQESEPPEYNDEDDDGWYP